MMVIYRTTAAISVSSLFSTIFVFVTAGQAYGRNNIQNTQVQVLSNYQNSIISRNYQHKTQKSEDQISAQTSIPAHSSILMGESSLLYDDPLSDIYQILSNTNESLESHNGEKIIYKYSIPNAKKRHAASQESLINPKINHSNLVQNIPTLSLNSDLTNITSPDDSAEIVDETYKPHILPVFLNVGSKREVEILILGQEDGLGPVKLDRWLLPFNKTIDLLNLKEISRDDKNILLEGPYGQYEIDLNMLSNDPELGLVISISDLEARINIEMKFDILTYSITIHGPWLSQRKLLARTRTAAKSDPYLQSEHFYSLSNLGFSRLNYSSIEIDTPSIYHPYKYEKTGESVHTITGRTKPQSLVQLRDENGVDIIEEVVVDESGSYRFNGIKISENQTEKQYFIYIFKSGYLDNNAEVRNVVLSGLLFRQLPSTSRSINTSRRFPMTSSIDISQRLGILDDTPSKSFDVLSVYSGVQVRHNFAYDKSLKLYGSSLWNASQTQASQIPQSLDTLNANQSDLIPRRISQQIYIKKPWNKLNIDVTDSIKLNTDEKNIGNSFYIEADRFKEYKNDYPIQANHDLSHIYLSALQGFYQQEKYDNNAEYLLKRELSIVLNVLPPDHPRVTGYIDQLATLYKSQKRYSASEALYQKFIDHIQRSLEKKHPVNVHYINELANIYYTMGLKSHATGHFSKAKAEYQKAIDTIHNSLSENHPPLAKYYNSLAEIYRLHGRYYQSEKLLSKALILARKNYPANSMVLAKYINNLALVYKHTQRYKSAEDLLLEATEIVRLSSPREHKKIAIQLNNLAELYFTQGYYNQAEPLYYEALNIARHHMSSDSFLAACLNNLADLYRAQGYYHNAESSLREALAIAKKIFPEDHLNLAIYLNKLTSLSWHMDKHEDAIKYLEKSLEIEEVNLFQNLDVGTEFQKQKYLDQFKGSTNAAISLSLQPIHRSLKSKELALTTILRRKGRILDVLSQSIQRLRTSNIENNQKQLNELIKQRSKLININSQEKFLTQPGFYNKQYELLLSSLNILEERISQISAELRFNFNRVGLLQVQKSIPKNAALLEYIQYHPIKPNNPFMEQRSTPHYAVYILDSDGDIQAVDLGPAEAINNLIEKYRLDISDVSITIPELTHTAQALYKQLIEPVEPYIDTKSQLLIAPDGQLNLIPYEALINNKKNYFVESHQISYLTSGRDLLQQQYKEESNTPPIIIASPNYNHNNKQNNKQSSVSMISYIFNQIKNIENRNKIYQYATLKNTLQEGEKINKILDGSRLLTGDYATEKAIKQIQSPQILHIATHGFFLDQQVNQSRKNDNKLYKRYGYMNSLLNTGLVLAGANNIHRGTQAIQQDDGILTAMEVAGINLKGTELVTLSACQTGLGTIREGEGIYGLRRAFTLAGARSQIMSLWNVRDVSTRDLMISYYNRLKNGEGKAKALRSTQLAMLRGEIKDPEGNTYKHPYFWAAFVLTGDWKPIRKILQKQRNSIMQWEYKSPFNTQERFNKFMLAGISIKASYSSIKPTSNDDRFVLGLVSNKRLKPKQNEKTYLHSKDHSAGGLIIKPFIDTNQNSIYDNGESIYTDPNLLIINNTTIAPKNPRTIDNMYKLKLMPGTYIVAIDPTGLPIGWQATIEKFELDVDAGKYKTVTIPLIPSYTITGHVFNLRDKALQGARVEAQSEQSGHKVTSITNGSGTYYLEGLKHGTYTLRVNGKITNPKTIQINHQTEKYSALDIRSEVADNNETQRR